MIDREDLGAVENGNSYHVSVPEEVDHVIGDYGSYHSDIIIEPISKGYHNAGWSYTEYEVRAASPGKAREAAEEIDFLAYCAFQETSTEA